MSQPKFLEGRNKSSYNRRVNFEWDSRKAKANLKNHKVSFDEAVEVFFDTRAIELYDANHSSATEARFQLIGFSGRRWLFVVFIDLTEKARW